MNDDPALSLTVTRRSSRNYYGNSAVNTVWDCRNNLAVDMLAIHCGPNNESEEKKIPPVSNAERSLG